MDSISQTGGVEGRKEDREWAKGAKGRKKDRE
jgi:hypothetical protein